MRLILFLLHCLFVCSAMAQSTDSFTQHLQQPVAGQGSVVLVQDESLDILVNNLPKVTPSVPAVTTPSAPVSHAAANPAPHKRQDTLTTSHRTTRVSQTYDGTRARHKVRGFRIQVYSGTGSGASKQAAKSIEAKVRNAFPELAVYCHFKAPRWICRVGDFSTREEAQRYLSKIRQEKISVEATIVADEVLLAN